jgi:hypothetical protein
MTYTPADKVPDDTVLLRKARYFNPLLWELVEEEELPQLSHTLAGSRAHKTIRIRLKPGTPTSCRIITWMQEWKQELDYSKAKLYRFRAGNVRLDDNSISGDRNDFSIAGDITAEAMNGFRQ